MAAAAELITLEGFGRYLESVRGGPRYLRALGYADEGSRSPPESRFRLVWELDAGWPHPLCNRPVFGLDGTHLGTPDLLDPDLGVVGEYDGADHRTRQRHARDVRRESAFRGAGLEYVPVVGEDLRHPSRVITRMQEARSRVGTRRAWTLDAPSWWQARCSDDS